MNTKSLTVTLSMAVLFLFFLHLVADFVGSIYALSLLAFSMSSGDLASLYKVAPKEAEAQVMIEIIKNVATGLILLSPVVLVFFRKRFPAVLMVILSFVVIASRIAEPFLPPRARMLVSGLGVGCFLLLLPPWIRREVSTDPERGSLSFGIGMALALLLSILLRALGRGVDLSLHGWFQALGWALGLAAAAVVPGMFIAGDKGGKAELARTPRQAAAPAGTGRATGISLGIVGVISLIYVVFSSPTIIARWTEGNYPAITAVAAAATAAFIILALARPNLLDRVPRWAVWLWNGALVLCLFLSVRIHQVGFPADPGAYPLAAPRIGAAGQIPVYLMLLLSPVILVDMTLLFRELGRRPPSIRGLGAGFAVASFVFLLLVFAVIFTTIWDYVPGVGPLFRDQIHLVLLIGALVATAPVLLATRDAYRFTAPLCRGRACWAGGLTVAVLGVGAILGAILGESLSPAQRASPDTIKVLTYNIQDGVDAIGRRNFDGQLGVLRQEQPDIVGLQESDTARITGGNADEVRFMASRLGYHSYYGPKTATGTFGIALLSRYPIEEARTFYLWSKGEQTAVIEARVVVGTMKLRVFVTHLGNYGPIAQQRDVLKHVPGERPVILMGDFNFTSDSEQYAITTALLEDSERTARDAGQPGGGEVIDHIFVSPGTEVLQYRHVGGKNSDHPAAEAVIRL